MKRFYEDSSQAKMLTDERAYRYAIKHMRNMEPCAYELRDYSRTPYFVVNSFITRDAAIAAKSFHEIQEGCHFAVVAVHPSYKRLKTILSSAYGMMVTQDGG